MTIKNYLINTVEDVRHFVIAANSVPFPVTVKQKNYVVDGKSILGLYSLDLTLPIFAEFETEENMEFFDIALNHTKNK